MKVDEILRLAKQSVEEGRDNKYYANDVVLAMLIQAGAVVTNQYQQLDGLWVIHSQYCGVTFVTVLPRRLE